MAFYFLHTLFRRRRRYRDATYVHADLSRMTEAPWSEKIWRRLFRSEYCDMDGSTAKKMRQLRRVLGFSVALLLLWFVVENALAWNVFS
ncbi:MAG: hypothetical protein LBV28_01820 [Puniceicoccales bacterium]|jgi:hypothetical protein|nr:hypothetical protein [Puniceicoccales bacterium]